MNIGGLVGALVPVFFVLILGFFAGKRNSFDADQAAGLSKLALTFALPASLFVGMAAMPKDLLLQQGRLVLALILSHSGLFLLAWACPRFAKTLSSTAAIIYALMLSTSATPVFGLAVLEPLLGPSSGAVGLMGTGYQSDGASSCSPFGNGCCVETATNRIEFHNAEPYPDWTQRRLEVAAALGADPRHFACARGLSSAKGCNELL